MRTTLNKLPSNRSAMVYILVPLANVPTLRTMVLIFVGNTENVAPALGKYAFFREEKKRFVTVLDQI